MKLSSLISENSIVLNLRGFTKQQIIDELIEALWKTGQLLDKNLVREAVIQRERALSTGLKYGVAVPHGKTKGVKSLVGVFGIKKDGVQFDSADGLPSQMFFMLVSPEDISGPHIQALSAIAKFFRLEENRNRLLLAESPAQVLGIFESEI